MRQEILDLKMKLRWIIKKLNILVLGGSQAAKIFGEKLPEIFIKLKDNGVNFKLYQQCVISQKDNLKKVYDDKKYITSCSILVLTLKIITRWLI